MNNKNNILLTVDDVDVAIRDGVVPIWFGEKVKVLIGNYEATLVELESEEKWVDDYFQKWQSCKDTVSER